MSALPGIGGAMIGMGGPTPRQFTISPSWAGRTTWDLDVHGTLDITSPGTWTITPLFSFVARVELNGAGGGGGQGAGTGNGGTGGTTYIGSNIAYGGGGGNWGSYTYGRPNGPGGTGGGASGGDTNIAGGNGGDGYGATGPGVGGGGGSSYNSGGYGAGGSGSGGLGDGGGGGGGGGGYSLKTLRPFTGGAAESLIVGSAGGSYGGAAVQGRARIS